MAIVAADRPAADGKKGRLARIIGTLSLSRGSRVTLASGAESTFYFDLKPTMLNPEGSNLIADLILEAIEEDSFDFIGGLEMGAVPVVVAVCQKSYRGKSISGFFVRKQTKDHGTKQRVEGVPPEAELKGKHVLLVDDVTTTGGSVLRAVNAARDAGCRVDKVVTVVDRREGARERLGAEGIELVALLDTTDFGV